MTNILLFAIGGNNWSNFIESNSNPSTVADMERIFRSFLNVFSHASVGWLIFSMLCFLLCGLYLERKVGSIRFVVLTLVIAFFSATATATNFLSVEWSGFSVAAYGLFGYIVAGYIFSTWRDRQRQYNQIFNIIYDSIAGVIIFCIILVTGFSKGNIIHNIGHSSAFLLGAVLWLSIRFFFFDWKKKGDKNKKAWYTRNYFFACTITLGITIILLYAIGGSNWQSFVHVSGEPEWGRSLYFNPTIRASLNAFAHLNPAHVFFNVTGLFVCGIYLERKTGSLKLCLMILSLVFFTSIVSVTSTFNAVHWIGFSGVLYLLYSYVIVDYIFAFKLSKKYLKEIIFGAVVLVCIYLGMSFDSSLAFVWYPYSLIFHEGHLFGFVAGLGLRIAVQTIKSCKKNSCQTLNFQIDVPFLAPNDDDSAPSEN